MENELGLYLKQKRTEIGWSQRELAARCGVSHGYLANLERGFDHATGKPTNPTVERLAKIAEGLGVDPDLLAGMLRGKKGGGMVRLPLYGAASCGAPNVIEEHPEEYQDWPEAIAGKADGILTVRGRSMEGVGFREGDLLFFRRLMGSPRNGQKVIALVDGEYTCKLYRRDEMGNYLEAAYLGDQTWRMPLRPGIELVALVVGSFRREE